MKDFWARFLSTLLHPLLMPVYTVLIIWYLPLQGLKIRITSESLSPILGPMVLFTTLMPVLFLISLKYLGVIQSVTLNDRRDRKYPLLGAMASNLALAWFFQQMQSGSLLIVLALGSAALVFIAWIITLWWKISIHMASLGGFLAILTLGYLTDNKPMFLPAVCMVILAILLGWARIERKAHSPDQVVAGLLLGLLIIGFSLKFTVI
ncbi:MAG: phosphatase PAP2 family protein [Bacteroidales bacterium]